MFFDAFQVKVTKYEMPQNGNHLRFEVGDGPAQILMIDHYDTEWDANVLQYRKEADKLFGPDILDMKSSIVSAIWFF